MGTDFRAENFTYRYGLTPERLPDEMCDGEPNNNTGLVRDHPIGRVGSPARSLPSVRLPSLIDYRRG